MVDELIFGGTNIKLGARSIPESLRNIGVGDQSIRNITSSSPGHNIGIEVSILYTTPTMDLTTSL